MSQCFPKPYEPFGRDMNVKVDLSNYAAKRETKNISHVDASNFALKSNIDKLKSLSNNLSNLKSKVDKLDIDKLVPLPIDLSKLSNVVNGKIKNIEGKIPDITNLATKTILNRKINEVKTEIPSTVV